MSASVTDKLRKASSGTRPEPTYLSAQKAIAAPSISLNAAVGWQGVTGVDVIIYRTDTAGVIIPGTQTDWIATLSGTTLSNMTLKAGTDQPYAAGEHSVVIAAPTAAWGDALIDALLGVFNQNGTLKNNIISSDQMAPASVLEAALQSLAVSRAKLANITRTAPLIPIARVVPGIGAPWSNAADQSIQTFFIVPDDYVSGDLTVKVYVRPTSTSTGNLSMYRRTWRSRPEVALEVIEGTPQFTTVTLDGLEVKLWTFDVAAAHFQAGDSIIFELNRDGPGVSDTASVDAVFDGGLVEYTGKA